MVCIGSLLGEAYSRGLKVRHEGGKLLVEGPDFCEDVAQRLLARKEEVIRFLKLEERLLSLPLPEFAKRNYILKLHSPQFGELWFVSHKGLIKHLEPTEGKAVFTGEELELLLQGEPTERDLQAIVSAKRTLGAKLTCMDHHSRAEINSGLERAKGTFLGDSSKQCPEDSRNDSEKLETIRG